MDTPTIDSFLAETSEIIVSSDGAKLQQYLPIEPPFPPAYQNIIREMKASFTAGSHKPLESKVNSALRRVRQGGELWSACHNFMIQYLNFVRDVDPSNLLETYNQLTELLQKCNSALLASEIGVIMLPTAVAYAKVLARLALGLEKKPELIAHLVEKSTDESGERMSLPERAANTIRQAFVACLNENAQYPPHQRSTPIGRHAGIYKFANICLKIFFQCKKLKNAEQIFTNVGAKSPPIGLYPRSERVTYLYYLGRFYFSVNHFYRAQAALQSAYTNCLTHPAATTQRRLILIYLIASNIILGRFPSDELYRRPEATGLKQRFQPLCTAIQLGDLATFRKLTDLTHEHADWFLHHRIFLQLKSRCEILVWRSLSRRVWNLVGFKPEPGDKRIPFLELEDLVNVARALESRSAGAPGSRHTHWVLTAPSPSSSSASSGPASPGRDYIDTDFTGLPPPSSDGDDDFPDPNFPNLALIEGVVSSLIGQGLVNGYISTQKKLAIQGASRRKAVDAGWPNVWSTISARCERSGGEVPGWRT